MSDECFLLLEVERRYWLARCLRLELKIADLEQQRAASWPNPRKHHRWCSDQDIAQMREWREKGRSCIEIAKKLRISQQTVSRHTKGAP